MKGSVYKRSDGKWVGAVDLGKDVFGKRKRKVVYGSTKAEVEDKVNTLLFELKTGNYIEPNKDTFISFLNDYYNVNQTKWQETTKKLYKMYIDIHFEPYFKQMKLSDIKPMELDKFYNYKLTNVDVKNNKTRTMSANTVRKLNTFLKAAFNYAVANNLMTNNPACRVVLPKKNEFKPTVYNEDQFLALLDAVSGTDDEIPILLGAGCGLRRGEIFGLRWKNIDFKNKTLTIETTCVRFKEYTEKKPKTESSKRTITLPDYVVDVLKLYRVKSRNSLEDDKVVYKWKPNAYSERFVKLLEKHGLQRIRLHDLRHYNAVIMMKRGVPDKVAADRLGHSTVTTLRNVYQHVLKDMDQTAAVEINDMFERKNSHQAKKA